ncbi:hypothetical protein [Mesorhizobium amorphae]|nr:hypothetical protein [Mesorhizobium amorphae]
MNRALQTAAFSREVGPAGALPFGNRDRSSVKRLIVQGFEFPWRERINARLTALVQLPKGWDGYQGRPVSFPTAYFCMSILEKIAAPGTPPPTLVPGSDGSLQIEWHAHEFDIEVDILRVNEVSAWMFDHRTDVETELELTNDFAEVAKWVEDLARRATGNAIAAAA